MESEGSTRLPYTRLRVFFKNATPEKKREKETIQNTMTHDRFGHSNLHTNGNLTHCFRSTGAIQPDDTLNNAVRIKNNHYRQKYDELPEPVVFMTVVASTSGRINEEFFLLLFFHDHRDPSSLSGELPEESAQFRFIRSSCLDNLKGSIGLMLPKVSVIEGYYSP